MADAALMADALGEPPKLTGVPRMLSDASHGMFRLLNRCTMVPLHRAGWGAWLGSPVSGWQCLLTTTGRQSGAPRPVPLGYIVMDGAAWVLAGYGPRTHWYRNILADPKVELRLPGRTAQPGVAAEVRDADVRARVIPALCRSMALPGCLIGCFPPASSDGRILACVSWVPLVRIRPADGSELTAGPDDPGGRGWVWRQAVVLGVLVLLSRAARRLCSLVRRSAGG